MSKSKLIQAVVVLALLVAVPALAHAPDVTITHINGVEVVPGVPTPISVPFLPFTVPIEGTVSHGDPGNLSPLSLQATDNGELFYGPERPYKGLGQETDALFDIPWTIEAGGVHVITVTARHGNKTDDDGFGGGGGTGDAGHGCKAAPAIAAGYLKGEGASKKGVISRVAHETGKKGSLWAKESCREDYIEDTITLVVDLL